MLSVKSHDISFLETTSIKSLLIYTWYTINEKQTCSISYENQYLYKHYYQKHIFNWFSVVISCRPIAILWVHSVRDIYSFGMHHHYYGSCKIARLFIVWVTYKNYTFFVEYPSFSEALQSQQYHFKWKTCSQLPFALHQASIKL